MKGYVPTPKPIVDLMVDKLFRKGPPEPSDIIIDPGCGEGPFIAGVLNYCEMRGIKPPQILGVENDPKRLEVAKKKFIEYPSVKLLELDYLDELVGPANYILGNPPYVAIIGLTEMEKARYRIKFNTAIERFDLYILFFEQSLRNLKPNGRLCFITPEKFEYVHSAAPLRRILTSNSIEEIHHIDEESFGKLVAYPTITTLEKRQAHNSETTHVINRDGTITNVYLPRDGSSWSGTLNGAKPQHYTGLTLADISIRVSCGVATGADSVFVHPRISIPENYSQFTYPTISGRHLGESDSTEAPPAREAMLVPYSADGKLLPQQQLGPLSDFLQRPDNARRLRNRTCVDNGRRPWYKFHDSVPLYDLLRPKILCKDVTSEPRFWADREGRIVPRHSVYYIVPKDGVSLDALLDYLNSEEAKAWLKAHCQRAANGYYRLQSRVLKRLPVPESVRSGKAGKEGMVQTVLSQAR